MCWVWCACCSMCTLLAHPRALQQLHVILFRRSDRLEPPPRPGSCLCRHACCCDERCWRWTRVTSRTAITGRSAARRCRGRCRRSPESCAAYRNDTDWAADCVPHRDRPKREDHVIPADSRLRVTAYALRPRMQEGRPASATRASRDSAQTRHSGICILCVQSSTVE